jgi:hypothetical protein
VRGFLTEYSPQRACHFEVPPTLGRGEKVRFKLPSLDRRQFTAHIGLNQVIFSKLDLFQKFRVCEQAFFNPTLLLFRELTE